MDNIPIQEIALHCKQKAEAKYSTETAKYQDTLYVSIDENNTVLVSYTPHILTGALQCLLIHRHRSLANTNWYDWYDVDFIDENGCVRQNTISDDSQIIIDYEKHFCNQVLKLYVKQRLVFKCKYNTPVEYSVIQNVWKLYTQCLECNSAEEAVLLGKLAMQDKIIINLKEELANKTFLTSLLEKERDQYKELLDTIKDIIK